MLCRMYRKLCYTKQRMQQPVSDSQTYSSTSSAVPAAQQGKHVRLWLHSVSMRPFVWRILSVLVITGLLIAVQSLLFTSRQATVRLLPDDRALSFLTTGMYAAEFDARGSYRWTSGSSQVRLPVLGTGPLLVFDLHLGPTFPDHPATQATLTVQDQQTTMIVVDDEPRRYRLALPSDLADVGELTVHIESATATVPPDTRAVGLRIEQAALTVPGADVVWLPPTYILVQLLLLAFGALMLTRIALPPLQSAGVLLAVAVVLLLLTVAQPLLLWPYATRFLGAFAVLTVLTYALLPAAERHLSWLAEPPLMRVVWGITLFACLLRLAGSLYPLFDAFDLELNTGRFLRTLNGDLVVVSRSIEFRNGITVYPPGAYVTLIPGALLGIAPPLLIQAGLAVIDGFGALTTAALARAFNTSARTAIFGALLYAAIPIHLTALWFGLTAQIFGQALMAPLAVALIVALRSERWRPWVMVGVLLTISLLTHIGVAIVAVAWLGLVWLLMLVQRGDQPVSRAQWWRFTRVLVLSGVASIIGIYGYVIGLKIEEMFFVTDKVQTSGYVPAYGLIVRAFRISFHELGWMLALPGLLLLAVWRRHLPRGGGEIIAGWLGVVVVFLAIEMVSGLQVRYIYFLTPLACVLIGLTLAALSRRGAAGSAAAVVIVVLLLVQGAAVWYQGALEGVMMSMSPLLR
jgi:hypothetical protein